MEQCAGGKHLLIVSERMLHSDMLHLFQGKRFGTIMQETGLLGLQGIDSVNTCQTARHPGNGKGMRKAARFQSDGKLTDPAG